MKKPSITIETLERVGVKATKSIINCEILKVEVDGRPQGSFRIIKDPHMGKVALVELLDPVIMDGVTLRSFIVSVGD